MNAIHNLPPAAGGTQMAQYHAVIRAPDGHEQDLIVEANNREGAAFEVGRLIGAYYHNDWTLERLSELH